MLRSGKIESAEQDRSRAVSALLRLLPGLLTLAVSLAASAQSQTFELPDMGASAQNVLSRAQEEEYARALVMQMRAYGVLNDDPLISAFFEDMGYRLAAHSDRPDKPFTFVVINQPAAATATNRQLFDSMAAHWQRCRAGRDGGDRGNERNG